VSLTSPATSWQLPRLRGSYGETCVIINFIHRKKTIAIGLTKTKKQTKINAATTVSKEEITGIQRTVDCPVN